MNNDEQIIKTILTLPNETRTIEFKRLGSKNESLDKTLQSIVAFANTDGGLIILGVDDPEKSKLKGMDRVFGIEENLELYDELSRAVDKIIPPISSIWTPQLIKIKEKNCRIAILNIPKSTDCLRSVDNNVWVRGEKGNKRLNPQEMIHFSYIKGFERADKELVKVDFEILKTSYYESWRRKRGIKEDQIENILFKTGLARKNSDGTLCPTRAAVLLFAEFPTDVMDTKCSIRIFQYEGSIETINETLNLISPPYNINGPLIKQITDAHEYVLNILKTGMQIPSGFVTKYKIPERAVKEAITNAVIHRDYHTKKDISVRIFEDRVEIESPGLLPFNITPANIGYVRAFGYRNDLIVKHLREFPDPPNLDETEGIRAMRKVMNDEKLFPPIFTTYPDIPDGVDVVLFNLAAPNEWDKINNYLTKNKYITNTEAREELKIDDTVKISKLFNKWVRKGLLIKIVPSSGSKREIKYRLPSSGEKSLFSMGESK